jgi:hypothetical protein
MSEIAEINLVINSRYGISLPSELSNGKFDDRDYYLMWEHFIITTDNDGKWRVWDIDAKQNIMNGNRLDFDSLAQAKLACLSEESRLNYLAHNFWGGKTELGISLLNESQLSSLKHKLTKQEKEDIIDRTPNTPYADEWIPLRLREDKVQYLQGKLPCITCGEKIFTSLTAAERHQFYCKEYGIQPPNGLYFTPIQRAMIKNNMILKEAETFEDIFTKAGLEAAMEQSKPYVTPDEDWFLVRLKKLLRPTWNTEPDCSGVSKSDLVVGGFGKKDITKLVKSLSQKEYIIISNGIIYPTPLMYVHFGYMVDWMYNVLGMKMDNSLSYFKEAEGSIILTIEQLEVGEQFKFPKDWFKPPYTEFVLISKEELSNGEWKIVFDPLVKTGVSKIEATIPNDTPFEMLEPFWLNNEYYKQINTVIDKWVGKKKVIIDFSEEKAWGNKVISIKLNGSSRMVGRWTDSLREAIFLKTDCMTSISSQHDTIYIPIENFERFKA